MTNEQLEEVKDAWMLFDPMLSKIPKKELVLVLRAVGLTLDKEEYQQLELELDPNESNLIAFDKFLEKANEMFAARDPLEEMRRMFSLFTQDQNATHITLEHLKRVGVQLGENQTDDEIREMIKVAGPVTEIRDERTGEIKKEQLATELDFENDWVRLLTKTKLY